MPNVWNKTDVVAVCCSDIHFSHVPPPARKDDWKEAMFRSWMEVSSAARELDVPIIIAGDIFDKALAPPELISFVINMFSHRQRGIWAIPGNHDLPLHNYDDIKRSAYWTLVEAGAIQHLNPDGPNVVQFKRGHPTLTLWAFPWGYEIKPCPEKPSDFNINVAVCHEYVWTDGFGHPEASNDHKICNYEGKLAGYDAAITGDNHQGWMETLKNGCNVINCGGLMHRKTKDVCFEPSFGLLHDDGTISRTFLDISKDIFILSDPKLTKNEPDVSTFLEFLGDALQITEENTLNFKERVEKWLESNDNIHGETKKMILEAVEA